MSWKVSPYEIKPEEKRSYTALVRTVLKVTHHHDRSEKDQRWQYCPNMPPSHNSHKLLHRSNHKVEICAKSGREERHILISQGKIEDDRYVAKNNKQKNRQTPNSAFAVFDFQQRQTKNYAWKKTHEDSRRPRHELPPQSTFHVCVVKWPPRDQRKVIPSLLFLVFGAHLEPPTGYKTVTHPLGVAFRRSTS